MHMLHQTSPIFVLSYLNRFQRNACDLVSEKVGQPYHFSRNRSATVEPGLVNILMILL